MFKWIPVFALLLVWGPSCNQPVAQQTACETYVDCEIGFECIGQVCLEGGFESPCWMCEGICENDRCVPDPNVNVYVALIRDLSVADSCTGSAPGSDIVYVALEDGSNTVLGYASLDYDGTTGDGNMFSIGFNLDGTPPLFNGACPEFDETSVTALGCGGEIGVRFLDERSRPVSLESSMKIRVFEHGGQCDPDAINDAYEVLLCTDTDAVVNDNTTESCTRKLGGGSGVTVISL
ncbi:MAG: hypothetical protein R3E66_19895 [bacterium]